MYARLVCSCLWIQSVLTLVDCNLHLKFKEFDELTPDNFTVVVKRNAVSGQLNMKIVSFFALRKYFVLHLVPGSPVLRKDFQAHMVDGDGRMTPVHVDQQIFYTGYLNGNPQHSVDAVHTDDVWIAQIHSPDDVYSIEPLTHHVPDSPATSMLIFRQRDINSSIFNGYSHENATLQPFCEEVEYPLSDSLAVEQRRHTKKNTSATINKFKQENIYNEKTDHRRVANNIFKKHLNSETHSLNLILSVYDTCEMLVIADFETYRGIGRANIFRMISILVYLYQSVDRIYRETKFDSLTNLGIAITNLFVHTEYTRLSEHYNMPNNLMTALRTLYSMSQVTNFSNYCLVHLSTQRSFGATVGIATTAARSTHNWGGGICARYAMAARNIGLSTPINAHGVNLPVFIYLLVVAHEIGHNWGAHHDPTEDYVCSPPSHRGGKYLMWPYTASGIHGNNAKFSPCSREEIAGILHEKAHVCFKPQSLVEEVCGNNIVDPQEDCDAGYLKGNPCCTSRCRFPKNAVCSPLNHPCCTNSCQIAPPTQKCFADFQDCHEDAFCSGTESHTCPETRPLPNNSTCQSLGKCWQGDCVTFCELLGATFTPARRLVDCTCEENLTTMCQHCCWNPQSKQNCTKMGGSKIDGTPCMRGVCNHGTCVSTQTNDNIFFEDRLAFSSGSDDIHQLGRMRAVLVTFVCAICGSLTLSLQRTLPITDALI
ncbi:unnamed protein product [Candidula unifasciata]|uniref:Uncharacterized protein n=1 Tax=Candidula unifasciata TaxID=100452 RepID=A0A8S3ZK64_9EUPU|nr:unnamed protein product [Candidula unifasciata]